MRRSEKQIENPDLIEEILRQERELSLAMLDGDAPYVVPMNYGYADGELYLHSAREGKKLDCLRANPKVCFEVHEILRRVEGEQACSWSTKFRSLIGRGTARILETPDEKRKGYDVLMRHFNGPTEHYADKALESSVVIRITIEELTGKQSL